MNRKTLALLLLLPMMVFVVDQAFGIGMMEGGKEKKAKKESPEAKAGPVEQEVQEQQVQEEPVPVKIVEKTEKEGGKERSYNASNAKAMAASLEETLEENRADFYDRFEDMAFRYSIEEIGGEETVKFLDKNVLEVLKKIDPSEISMKKWFSRCGTRYNYSVYTDKEGQLTNYGEMIISEGCDEQPLGRFRYDVASESVEAFVSKEHGYIGLKEYFKLYSKIES